MELTENQKGYIAGIIDGEGSVCLSKKAANEHRSPELQVTSTTKEILTYLQELCEGVVSSQKIYKDTYKPSWRWTLRGDKAINLLTQIKDQLLVPEKKYRATLIVEEYKKVTPRNGKYSPEKLAAKLDFEKRFFEFE